MVTKSKLIKSKARYIVFFPSSNKKSQEMSGYQLCALIRLGTPVQYFELKGGKPCSKKH